MYLKLFTKDKKQAERVYLALGHTLVKFGIVEHRNLQLNEFIQGVAIRRMTHMTEEEIDLIEGVCDTVLDCCDYSENHFSKELIQEKVLKDFKVEFLNLSKSFREWVSTQNNEGRWVKQKEVKDEN
jgi:hypothetical protein